MAIDTPKPQTPEGLIRYRLRVHGFSNTHATIIAHTLVFAQGSDEFVKEFGTFGVELLREAILAFATEDV